jgi:hypothetical protein
MSLDELCELAKDVGIGSVKMSYAFQPSMASPVQWLMGRAA